MRVFAGVRLSWLEEGEGDAGIMLDVKCTTKPMAYIRGWYGQTRHIRAHDIITEQERDANRNYVSESPEYLWTTRPACLCAYSCVANLEDCGGTCDREWDHRTGDLGDCFRAGAVVPSSAFFVALVDDTAVEEVGADGVLAEDFG